MKIRGLILGILSLVICSLAAQAAEVSIADLQNQAQQMKAREAKIWSAREAEQRAELEKQEKRAADAQARRARAEARSNALDTEWNANDAHINDMNVLLRQHQGNLGELFGVTPQVAGDSAGVLNQSLINTQLATPEGQESRVDFMRRIAGAKELPAFSELERMWYELQREMTESGKVAKYEAPVIQPDDSVVEQEVVRVGPFIATAGNRFLSYSSTDKSLTVLPRQLGSPDRSLAMALAGSAGSLDYEEAVVDPARGALLDLVVGRPNFVERIQHGEAVGYLIVIVGVIGFVLAIYQYGYLFRVRKGIKDQLDNLSSPNASNPLGRVMMAFNSTRKEADSAEVVELRLSEAVVREVPKLQRFQVFLKLVVAAGPLLGLVGTVIGMIITFHAITASGSSDPRIMANGIGQAMIATVLGLGIAIPLLFLNTGLTALSNGITQILDEQAQALLAKDLEAKSD
ncbi:MAG: MotA/TolQ/ExbB proton channel family protein [Porticoccaceae bacterium]